MSTKGSQGQVKNQFWAAIWEELAVAGLGLENDAEDEIRKLIDSGVSKLAAKSPSSTPDDYLLAEHKLRFMGRQMIAHAFAGKVKKITKGIVDEVKKNFCPFFPFC
jgi:hypothetical protein